MFTVDLTFVNRTPKTAVLDVSGVLLTHTKIDRQERQRSTICPRDCGQGDRTRVLSNMSAPLRLSASDKDAAHRSSKSMSAAADPASRPALTSSMSC